MALDHSPTTNLLAATGGEEAAVSALAADLLAAAAAAVPAEPLRAAELAQRAAALLPAGSARHGQALGWAARLCDGVDPARAWPLWEQAARHTGRDTRVEWLAAAGDAAQRAGAWPEADRLLRTALAQAGQRFGQQDARTAQVGHSLAILDTYTGAFAEAAALCDIALSAANAASDVDFQAAVSRSLGVLCRACGEVDVAEQWARRAVTLRTSLPCSDAVRHKLAVDQKALAATLVALGRHIEAATLLDAAADAFTKLYGNDHCEIGLIDGIRALIYLAVGDFPGAERAARKAVTVQTDYLGIGHPELAPTLTTLGTALHKQHRYSEACEYHERALALLQPVVHHSHPLIATISDNLRHSQRGE
jgi:tetratricopeptide (TPR) repeat protein